MIWKRCKVLLIALLCSIALFLARSAVCVSDGHRFEGQCERCHLNATQGGAKPLFVKDIDALCRKCHPPQEEGLSHPSGIKPSFPLPQGMELDWTGKMTCATCHRIHGEGKYLLASEKTGKAFCVSCHRETLLAKGNYGHEAVSSRLHQPRYETADLHQPLDRESQECLGCHDYGPVALRGGTAGAGVWNHGDAVGFSHPVGVDYQVSAKKRGYKALAALDKKIRIFNGKLGCGSCHSLYSTLPKNLVVSIRGSALCLECHDK